MAETGKLPENTGPLFSLETGVADIEWRRFFSLPSRMGMSDLELFWC